MVWFSQAQKRTLLVYKTLRPKLIKWWALADLNTNDKLLIFKQIYFCIFICVTSSVT